MSLIIPPKKITGNLPKEKNPLEELAKSKGQSAVATFEKKTGLRFDPAPAYLFNVEISGVVVGLFTKVSGLGASRTDETVVEGGYNNGIRHLPGPVCYSNIILSRGLTVSQELWNWFDTGKYDLGVNRLNITINQGAPGMNLAQYTGLMTGGYGIVKSWNIERAFPVSWKMSDLDVNNVGSAALETLEIAHEGISLSKVVGLPMFSAGSLF